MYYVKHGKIAIIRFETLDRAINYAKKNSQEKGRKYKVKNSLEKQMCEVKNGVVFWEKKEYMNYYEELKKGD